MAHKHTVRDTNAHFTIDQFTRQVKNDSTQKTTIVQYDHNSERLTFEMPLYIDGHAMTLCNLIELHFINISAEGNTQHPGTYEVTDIKAEGDKAIFTWLISQEATQLVGSLNFLIVFKCVEDGKTVYRWSTEIFKNLSVSSGMDNGEAVLTEYPDILAQWKTQLFDASDTAVSNVATAEAKALAAIEEAGEAKKQSVLDSIPDEYEELSALVDQSHRNKAGAIVLDAEGESIVVNDASAYPLQNLKLFGKSTQDGTPTPDAPVEIVSVENPCVNAYGKNRFPLFEKGKSITVNGMTFAIDEDGIITLNGTASAITWVEVIYAFKMGTNPQTKKLVALKETEYYVFSRIVKGGNVTGSVSNTIQTDNAEIVINQDVLQRVFQSGGVYRGWITVAKDTVCNNYAFGLQIEKGNVATDYEPYNEQTIETAHTLPGIPVSSGGNYTDANGQQWICDEVDLARGVYVQRVNVVSFNGTENWQLGDYNGTKYLLCALGKPGISNSSPYGVCTHATLATWGAVSSLKGNDFFVNPYAFFSVKQGDVTYTNADDWKVYIAEQSANGMPVEVYYAIATPIETPLSEAEISAFKALHSNKPNTTILNDAGAYMAVEYVADTKTYIDNKIAESLKGSEQA